jgi:TRAP-type mannitol/chloroaromatic compound transport system substrate-binding protein
MDHPPPKESRVNRRSLLKAAVLGSGAAIAAPAISKGLMEWRMVTSWPKGLPGLGTGAERLAANITAMSGGRLTIKVYAAGELVPALECFGAVANGTAQMGHDAAYYHAGKSEGAPFFTAFPFGFTTGEMAAWVKHGNGQKLWDELYAPFGIRGFQAGSTGTQMFGWFRREIRSLEDLKGLKFRTPGNQGRVLQKLGVTPVSLPGGEIFPALQSGAIDGAEWVGPYNDLALGFYQVCRYYYSPGYHEPGPALQLTVNEQAWRSLTPELQAIVRAAADSATVDMYAEYNARSGPALRTLVKDHGVIVRALPEDVLLACGEKSSEVLNEIHAADTSPNRIVRRIIEDFLAFRQDVIPWTRVGEQAFLNARRLPFEFKLK